MPGPEWHFGSRVEEEYVPAVEAVQGRELPIDLS